MNLFSCSQFPTHSIVDLEEKSVDFPKKSVAEGKTEGQAFQLPLSILLELLLEKKVTQPFFLKTKKEL